MNRFFPLFLLFLSAPLLVRADDRTRDVQTQLKTQGFYYGDVDGKNTPELSAAIRRFQIRNGLEVTGELNQETNTALGIGGSAPSASKAQPSAPAPSESAPPPVAARRATPAEPKSSPPINLRRANPEDESAPPVPEAPIRYSRGRDTALVPPPAPLDDRNPIASLPPSGSNSSGGSYAQLFAGTPYATAPRVVQEGTLRRAQQILAGRGLYRDDITGQPGPGLEEALLTFQRGVRLPLTGRLDMQTLSILRLLPGRGPGNPPLKPFNSSDPGDSANSRPTYRGIWVQ